VRRGWLRAPRLGIGWRLGLGLAAVAGVLVAGEQIATRTTREALDAVRSMQSEHEPLADSASAVLEKLVAHDRAVGEYARAPNIGGDLSTITRAGDALEAAVAGYTARSSSPPPGAAAAQLREQITQHIAFARQLAADAAQRAQWTEERQAALNRVYQRIAAAGGSGLAINGTQVVARRSLAELESAINAVRGNVDTAAVIARRERDFMALLTAHMEEFESSPGRVWLGLEQQEFLQAARLRRQLERYDTHSGPQWHHLFEQSAALTEGIHDELQKPADRGLLQAAQHAASAAEVAERMLRNTGAVVLDCCWWCRRCWRSASACRCAA
jgi:hypothetical protein